METGFCSKILLHFLELCVQPDKKCVSGVKLNAAQRVDGVL